MDVNTIVIQAGGKGTRLEHLTRNRPKAIVPVNNLPIIFHLFRKFPDKRYIVIGDYKCDVLRRYLEAFAKVDFTVVDAKGTKGTCGGLSAAVGLVEEHEPFMLIWSDLILSEDFTLPERAGNYVGLSKDFTCRWKYENHAFAEETSKDYGVAGLFIFEDNQVLRDVPTSGEFVRWLQGQSLSFDTIGMYQSSEYGLLEDMNAIPVPKCRPFNRITVEGDRLIKEGIDAQGKALAKRETAWYQKVFDKGFTNIPKIYSMEPLVMERITGKNIYAYKNLAVLQKKKILHQIVDCLTEVHKLGSVPSDMDSYREAYLTKTYDRLKKVKELVPFAKDETITINGRACRNIFNCQEQVEQLIVGYFPKEFVFLHGDCTFCNMMLQNDEIPMMIDPRGYFGTTEFYGDVAYDWAKLYYSLAGNYDQFNLKRFDLNIGENEVALTIESNGWEELEDEFFRLVGSDVTRKQIQLIHAIIWLSLTTYAWEDYDSICGAFYHGLELLEDALS